MTPRGSMRDCPFPSSGAAIINRRAAQRYRQGLAGVNQRVFVLGALMRCERTKKPPLG
jgi:hypothetical protein